MGEIINCKTFTGLWKTSSDRVVNILGNLREAELIPTRGKESTEATTKEIQVQAPILIKCLISGKQSASLSLKTYLG